MHWAMRTKKEPMLEASEEEIPVSSRAEDLHAEQEEPGIPSHNAGPSSSKQIFKVQIHLKQEYSNNMKWNQNGQYGDLFLLTEPLSLMCVCRTGTSWTKWLFDSEKNHCDISIGYNLFFPRGHTWTWYSEEQSGFLEERLGLLKCSGLLP